MKQNSLLHKMSYKLDRKNVRQGAFKTNFIQIHTIIQLQVIKVLYVTIEFEDPVNRSISFIQFILISIFLNPQLFSYAPCINLAKSTSELITQLT